MSRSNDDPPPKSNQARLFLFACRDCGRQTRLTWDETQMERACAGCGRTISVQEVEMLLEADTLRVKRPGALKKKTDKNASD